MLSPCFVSSRANFICIKADDGNTDLPTVGGLPEFIYGNGFMVLAGLLTILFPSPRFMSSRNIFYFYRSGGWQHEPARRRRLILKQGIAANLCYSLHHQLLQMYDCRFAYPFFTRNENLVQE
jgi:hypothetical protein